MCVLSSISDVFFQIFKHKQDLNSSQFFFISGNNYSDIDSIEQLPDGIILRRGKQCSVELGEPMVRKVNDNEKFFTQSSHSINELNSLLSERTCSLMRQYRIESVEDLVRLFLEQGQQHFSGLMINLFKVNPFIVDQLNSILIKWARKLTRKNF